MEKFVFKDYGQAVEIADFINNVIIPDFNSLLERHINACAKGKEAREARIELANRITKLESNSLSDGINLSWYRLSIESLESQVRNLKAEKEGVSLKCVHGVLMNGNCYKCQVESSLYNNKSDDETFANHWHQRGRREMKAELKNKFEKLLGKNPGIWDVNYLKKELFDE